MFKPFVMVANILTQVNWEFFSFLSSYIDRVHIHKILLSDFTI